MLRYWAGYAALIVCVAQRSLWAQENVSLSSLRGVAQQAETMLATQEPKRVDVTDPQLLKAFQKIPGRVPRFYDIGSVRALLNESKQFLERQLAGRAELMPLREYVQRFYPNDVGGFPVLSADRLKRGLNVTPDTPVVVPEEWVISALTRARGVASGIRGMSTLTLDLSVLSKPEQEATFTLHTRGGIVHNGTTNATFKGVYRGLYFYTVSKNGMKTIVDDLNLVNDPRPVLNCTLISEKRPEGPAACDRQ